jgi:signal transduction histidine kinase
MHCLRCQHENRPQAKFCEQCGTPFTVNVGSGPASSYTEIAGALSEALDQQTAASEILGVISSSPTDLLPVMQAVTRHAARLTRADHALIGETSGGRIRWLASFGCPVLSESMPISRQAPSGRAILDCETTQAEITTTLTAQFSEVRRAYEELGVRTILATPLVREGRAVGVLLLRRTEARPFRDKEIALLQTFADQASIAIENVRLFNDTKEALEQQKATAEILRVIARSATDLQSALEAVAEKAARLCESSDAIVFQIQGDELRPAAIHGAIGAVSNAITRGFVTGRAVIERRTIHVEDLAAAVLGDFPDAAEHQRRFGHRTTLATPLLREGVPIGAITIRRREVRPFTAGQVRLLETFADQAVIAIENVRLFRELEARTAELTRSVGELRALGDVGRALSSTLDLDTILQTIVTRASQLAGTDACSVFEYDETTEAFHLRATHNLAEEVVILARRTPTRKGEGVQGRMAVTRQPVQIPDIAVEEAYRGPLRDILLRTGTRAVLAVPLLREGQLIGGLTVNRKMPGAFAPETIELLQTFATQSALAIQNARLFRQIADKSRQLEAASRHKSEFLANMSHELRTPLNAILGFSEVLAERMFGDVNEKQAEYLQDILSSGRHLLALINDILDLSKVEAGRLELELERFHLPTVIDNALTLVRERATRHGIALTQTVNAGVGDIVADARKVKQVVLNLLSNAVKFTPEGGRVSVIAAMAEDGITIAVTDTGIGIAPGDQAAIFEEFRQVGRDDARKQEGTGLGLTLAKKFVELHGGRIWVESHVGQGSTFTFILPVRPWPTSAS